MNSCNSKTRIHEEQRNRPTLSNSSPIRDVYVVVPAVTTVFGADISITVPWLFLEKKMLQSEKEKSDSKKRIGLIFCCAFHDFFLLTTIMPPFLSHVLTEHKTRSCNNVMMLSSSVYHHLGFFDEYDSNNNASRCFCERDFGSRYRRYSNGPISILYAQALKVKP